MGRILVTPEQLDQVSKQFKTASEQSQQMSTKLAQSVKALDSQWDGMTQQRFFQEFQDAQKQMTSYVQLLNSVGQELKDIAERFRQLDNAK
ncbi:WXG100 family type VII secretion target [Bacillus fengqiuensis]|nr:WXG100 family type VII secretion target [Bacillus fengqiuensis]